MRAALAIVALVAGCQDKPREKPMPLPVGTDAAGIDAAIDKPWPELDGYPTTQALRVIPVPARVDVPRFEVGGPVLQGDLAVVSSSQIGFAGIDWRRGAVLWTKPSGSHVAPPVLHDDTIVLIGSCLNPPAIPDGERLLGCMRVVTPGGVDLAYLAIRGTRVAEFLGAVGEQTVWSEGAQVRWRRGDAAVAIDLLTGIAKPATATTPPIAVTVGDRAWSIAQLDGRIVATGTRPWRTEQTYTAIVGLVNLPAHTPMLRIANLGEYAKSPEVNVIDIDATGSLRASVARPSPGISLLGLAAAPNGDTALAIRLDTSLRRDYLAGYAASAHLVWVYPLPPIQRADPVGVAMAPDAVVVFHDGDTLTVLPPLSVPPTAPGAAPRNPTP
ncbi:MAG: hypothetical protein WKG01_31735 [Kofleriaceae bacterium]